MQHNNNNSNSSQQFHSALTTAMDQPAHQKIATKTATVFSSHELAMENVMPSIFLTKNFIAWNEENLHAHGFTHIIIIDKHIQELYYPSLLFELAEQSKFDAYDSASPFEYFYYPPVNTTTSSASTLSFGKEFEVLDLNFGEKSYLTTVLPNCYLAVKFINKALRSNGTILVIDCNAGEQKCVTIVVAYLMFKYNIRFKDAFARLKQFYKKADLDRFYSSQLYEYEPILQVQRAHSRGHSCSRARQAAILKRKKAECEASIISTQSAACTTVNEEDINAFEVITLNPLTQFNAVNVAPTSVNTQSLHQTTQNNITQVLAIKLTTEQELEHNPAQMSTYYKSAYNNNWDDFAME